MKLLFKVSETMNRKTGEDKINERKTVRLSKKAREVFGIEIGAFLNLKLKNHTLITLFVDFAYEEDVKTNGECAYVTQDVFDLLDIESNDVAIHEGITLGCDPELVLADTNTGIIADAHKIFKSKSEDAGSDGVLFEMRPLPSTAPAQVMNSLYEILAKARRILNAHPVIHDYPIGRDFVPSQLMLVAKSSYNDNLRNLTLGFHLHYGLPLELLGHQKKFITTQMARVLDYYVGIPSIVPEGTEENHRRTCTWTPYGKPGNFRVDYRTFEYRVPGAVLMRHPLWALGLMSLGATVVEDCVSRIKEATNNFKNLNDFHRNDNEITSLYPNVLSMHEIINVVCNPSVHVAESLLTKIKADVEKMIGFGNRKREINNFFGTLKTNFPVNVEYNWWRYKDEQRQSGSMDVLHASS